MPLPLSCSRSSASVWLFVALLAHGVGCDRRPKLATLAEVSGDVVVQADEQARNKAAKAKQALYEGNIVATGAESAARVVFASGSELTLSPDSRLRIQAGGSQVVSFGAVLLSGDVRSKKGTKWAIGTPFGIVTLGSSDANLRVDTKQGLSVLVGEVELLRNDGQSVKIGEGQLFALDGLVIPIKKRQEFTLDTMTVTLVGSAKRVMVKRKGEDEFTAAKENEALGEGDAVRSEAGGARMRVGDSGEIALGKNSEATFTALRQGGGEQTVTVELKGDADLKFARGKDEDRVQRVLVAGHTVELRPGLQASDAQIEELEGGNVRVTTRAGHVVVDETTRVQAGETVLLAAGVAPEVKELFAPIRVASGKDAIVYYDKRIPNIGFTWPASEGQTKFVFELSANKKFAPLVFTEELASPHMVYDRFEPGSYFWRVKVGDGYVSGGALGIAKDTSRAAKVKRVNTVEDTGESTVVYFQRVMPAITLRWKANDRAASYRVKMFRDDDFDEPIVNKVVNGTEVTLPPSTFEEGGFLWVISALDAEGKTVATGKMNNLQIAFDNAVSGLVIKTPKKSDVVRVKRLITRGEAEVGTALSINGRVVGLDSKGRFGEPVMLEQGFNFVVYKINAKDGLERYYLRDVILK